MRGGGEVGGKGRMIGKVSYNCGMMGTGDMVWEGVCAGWLVGWLQLVVGAFHHSYIFDHVMLKTGLDVFSHG